MDADRACDVVRAPGPLRLWRLTWSHTLGVYWMACDVVTADTADAVRRILENTDAQGVVYVAAVKAPGIGEGDQARARHATVFP